MSEPTEREYKWPHMPGPTIKAVRHGLGVSLSWFAEQLGVDEDTVLGWETERTEAPTIACMFIAMLEEIAQRMVDRAVAGIYQQMDAHGRPSEPLLLVSYANDEDFARYCRDFGQMSAEFHLTVLARVRWTLVAAPLHLVSVIRQLDASAYEAWRSALKQEDSDALRSQFAALADHSRELFDALRVAEHCERPRTGNT